MCHLRYKAMCGYQEIATTAETDRHMERQMLDKVIPICFEGDTTRTVITAQILLKYKQHFPLPATSNYTEGSICLHAT